MKNIKKTMAATLIAVGTIGAAGLAVAGSGKGDHLQLANASIQFNDAIQIATAAVPGKVFEVELEMERKKAVWEVEILSAENQMVELEIDANTGDILSQEIEND